MIPYQGNLFPFDSSHQRHDHDNLQMVQNCNQSDFFMVGTVDSSALQAKIVQHILF